MSMFTSRSYKCSFCGKTQNQVQKLIAGPDVCICDSCVELCTEIITEEAGDRLEAELPDTPDQALQLLRTSAQFTDLLRVVLGWLCMAMPGWKHMSNEALGSNLRTLLDAMYRPYTVDEPDGSHQDDFIDEMYAMAKAEPHDRSTRRNLALALYRGNFLTEAVPVFEQLLAVESGDRESRYLLALCHLKLGHTDNAKHHWEHLIAADSNDSLASRAKHLLQRLALQTRVARTDTPQ